MNEKEFSKEYSVIRLNNMSVKEQIIDYMISFEVRVERSGKPIKNTARGVVFFSLQSSNVKILYFYGICQ